MDDEICYDCNGSGEGMYDGSTCYTCKGTGECAPESDSDYDCIEECSDKYSPRVFVPINISRDKEYDSSYDSDALEWGGMNGY